jgi:TolA-binding protein
MNPNVSRRRVFIIRPWNNPKASLYPHMMDGVEYVNAVINTIKSTFGDERFEVRVDEDVFVPGLTLRQNLERELVDAEIILAILDGLRPNVVYELGFAFGLREAADVGPDDLQRQIICLAERNATVLVRNYYSDPLAVPTTTGESVTILNPPLNICSSFSDNSDLLILNYDRLDLVGTLASRLKKLISEIQRDESKQDLASQAAATELRPSPATLESTGIGSGNAEINLSSEAQGTSGAIFQSSDLWDMYERGDYQSVVERAQPPKDYEQKKVLGLSLMKLGRIYDAMQTWKDVLSNNTSSSAALFHLGVCYFVVKDYEKSAYYFEAAQRVEGLTKRIEVWMSKLAGRRRYGNLASPGAVEKTSVPQQQTN